MSKIRLGIALCALVLIAFVLVQSEPAEINHSSELAYSDVSPLGEKGGRVVPASCGSVPPVAHFVGDIPAPTPCQSAPNSCGMTGTGQIDACGTMCIAAVPPDSACPRPEINIGTFGPTTGGGGGGGSNTGVGAGGNISGGGVSGVNTPTAGGGVAGGTGVVQTRQTTEQIVNKGGRCQIYWSALRATSCTLTGPGINYSGLTGNLQTPRMGIDTPGSSVYTLRCMNGAAVAAEATFSCKLNVTFVEQ